MLAPFGVGIAVFVMAGAVTDIAERTLILRVPFRAALRRALGLPRSAWGTAFAHFGIGVTLLGIVGVTAWGSERIAEIKPGDSLDIAHYRLTFDGMFNRAGPNYHDVVGRFTVHRMNGELIGIMEPSRRTFPARNMATTEAALMSRGVKPALSLARRSESGRHRAGAALFQAARADDLARRRDHVLRRRAVALGSAAARRRAAPGEGKGPRHAATGGVMAVKYLHALMLVVVLPGRLRSGPFSPTKCWRTRRWKRAPAPVQGIALHGLSERIDRRIPRRRSPTICAFWCGNAIKAGDSDAQVIDFLVARYGEFVLLKPRLSWHTALLWGTAARLLLIGIVMLLIARGAARACRPLLRQRISPRPRKPASPSFCAAGSLLRRDFGLGLIESATAAQRADKRGASVGSATSRKPLFISYNFGSATLQTFNAADRAR